MLTELDCIGYAHPIDAKKRWTEGSSCAARIPRLCLCVYAVLAVSLFLCCAWSKLSFLFDRLFYSDDLMNVHESYIVRPNVLLRAMALPFSTFNRPTGALYYRLCFETSAGTLPRWKWAPLQPCSTASIYTGNGTVTMSFWAFFVLLTLWYCTRVRQEGLRWSWSRIAILLSLYIAALNSKEMAAVVPTVLLVFEYLRCFQSRVVFAIFFPARCVDAST